LTQKKKSTFSSNPNLFYRSQKKRTKKRIKYVIIASISGTIYGAFNPLEMEKAREYLDVVRAQEPYSQINLYKVSNLNKFLSNIKYVKRKTRTFAQINSDAEREHRLVPDSDENSPSSD
jgi:hypothetical protein